MRAVRLLVVLALAAALAGCLGGDEDPDAPGGPESSPEPPGEGGDGTGGSGESGDLGDEPPEHDEDGEPSTRAPSLSPGLAWTYNATGRAVATDEVTVVVARAGQAGYLFAGATPADLHEEATRNRSWLGWQSEELNPKGEGPRLFDFPLEDGKTWSTTDGTVTAERTQLDTEVGSLEGYRMTVDGANRTWTYASGVGYLVSYEETRGDATMVKLELEGVDRRDNATWYTSEARLRIRGTDDGVVDVTDGSTILLAGGGDPGATITVTPPVTAGQGPWITQVRETPSWAYIQRTPAEGSWRVSAGAPPDGTVGAALTAVAWTELATQYGSTV